jgi:hypothetical protein
MRKLLTAAWTCCLLVPRTMAGWRMHMVSLSWHIGNIAASGDHKTTWTLRRRRRTVEAYCASFVPVRDRMTLVFEEKSARKERIAQPATTTRLISRHPCHQPEGSCIKDDNGRYNGPQGCRNISYLCCLSLAHRKSVEWCLAIQAVQILCSLLLTYLYVPPSPGKWRSWIEQRSL